MQSHPRSRKTTTLRDRVILLLQQLPNMVPCFGGH